MLRIVQDGQATAEGLELPEQVLVQLRGVAASVKDGLLALSVSAGLAVIDAIVEDEVAAVCGPKGKHDSNRVATRHGSESAKLKFAGQNVDVRKPRARSMRGGGEVRLVSWEHFASADAMSQVALERMLAGVSTRRYAKCVEPIGQAHESSASGTSKSSISREFVERTERALDELMGRSLDSTRLVAIMIDGVELASEMCVAALGIDADGVKAPLGLWHGSTENATVATHLLTDLVDRGLDVTAGVLVVIDGGKGIAKAVRDVFGDAALVQRCHRHKERNVLGHLPDTQKQWVRTRLRNAWHDPSYEAADHKLRRLAGDLAQEFPGAAASLREGMTDTITVTRLGITGLMLHKTLSSTNAIESMMDIVRTRTRNVKRWRDGKMRLRWTAAGMLDAERSFRRVKGHRDIPILVAAIKRELTTTDTTTTAAHAA
jgi:transposase-like protein